ncbi:MAG: serine/threonine protein kinase [Gemmataceae bacterium]|nr:serine/threonine protein kinase [Gemmataceae bacterium]
MGFLSKLFGGGKGGAATKGLKRSNILKRFDLSGRTGQGSMSKVYRAYDNEIGRIVCLKVLDREKTKKFEDRFRAMGLTGKPSEGEVCLALRHENIVRTFEYGLSTQGDPYLVMEWVEGHGLNYLIETRNANLNGNRVNYLGQLCDAVGYMHDAKYLHRDLCPRNVMVDQDGVLKLIDFGLTIPYTPQFCQPGNRTGTADYLAPEIIKRKATDHRVDLFALGVTAFEVFTGQLPWERSPSSEETLRRHLNTPARDPKALNPKLDDDLCGVLTRAVDREPSARFATANAFKDALKKLDRQDY